MPIPPFGGMGRRRSKVCPRRVVAGGAHGPDWRDGAAYEPLLEADRSLLAWEWLRRDPAYRAAAERALLADKDRMGSAEAAAWGLHAFIAPDASAPSARPVWRSDVHPFVLGVKAVPTGCTDDAFELERFAPLANLLPAGNGGEHLLISDGLRSIRIDVLAGSIAQGPVELRYRLAGLSSAEHPMLTLRRFLALCRTGRFCRSLHPREVKARRWVLMLRAHDALAAGAGQRAIAEELLGTGAALERWRVEAPSLRSQAQRLAKGARRMAGGDFRTLLR